MTIRPEHPADEEAIRRVNEEAFGRAAEANLVELLRAHQQVVLSLVAVVDDQIIGHILFCPVTIEGTNYKRSAVGLGPMAVLPSFQNQGVGSALVRQGLDELRSAGHKAVAVLGHPKFYPRFSFVPSSHYGIASEFDVPEEVFMVAELVSGALADMKGTVVYPSQFNDPL